VASSRSHVVMKYLTITFIFLALYMKIAAAVDTCWVLTTYSSLCAYPPGTSSSDGFDDVCLLVECCTGQSPLTVQIPSGEVIPCIYVMCSNVCRLEIDRTTLGGEACVSTCNPPSGSPAPNIGPIPCENLEACVNSPVGIQTRLSGGILCSTLLEWATKLATVAACEAGVGAVFTVAAVLASFPGIVVPFLTPFIGELFAIVLETGTAGCAAIGAEAGVAADTIAAANNFCDNSMDWFVGSVLCENACWGKGGYLG